MVLDGLVGSLGPFLIPVVVFVFGVIGYGILFMLNRLGILGRL